METAMGWPESPIVVGRLLPCERQTKTWLSLHSKQHTQSPTAVTLPAVVHPTINVPQSSTIQKKERKTRAR